MEKSTRIWEDNLNSYLFSAYQSRPYQVTEFDVPEVRPLRQRDFGKGRNCSLSSVTSLICELSGLAPERVYPTVKVKGQWHLYGEKLLGTNPVMVKGILNQSLQALHVPRKTKSAYAWMVTFEKIKEILQKTQHSVVFNLFYDGRNYYKDHTVLIIGWKEVALYNGKTVHLLKVLDNWHTSVSYLDFDKVWWIRSINYVA